MLHLGPELYAGPFLLPVHINIWSGGRILTTLYPERTAGGRIFQNEDNPCIYWKVSYNKFV